MKNTTELTTSDYLYSLGQQNLVYNYNFTYYSNQLDTAYGTPDGWVYNDTGNNGKINFDPDTLQCVITKSDNDEKMTFTQALHEFPRAEQMLQGETVTGKIVLNTDKDGDVNVTLSDGVTAYTGTTSKKGDVEIDIQLSIDQAATELILTIASAVPFMVLSLSSCNVNIGEVSIKNLPCAVTGIIGERKQYIATENPPAEELSLCNATIELTSNQTRLNSVLNGRFGIGNNGNSMLPDMRGYFSRSWDNGATVDPNANDRTAPGTGTITGDHVSTFEQDVFLKHDHGLDFTVTTAQSTTGGTGPNTSITTTASSKTNEELDGKETRPKNINELYTIKWS